MGDTKILTRIGIVRMVRPLITVLLEESAKWIEMCRPVRAAVLAGGSDSQGCRPGLTHAAPLELFSD